MENGKIKRTHMPADVGGMNMAFLCRLFVVYVVVSLSRVLGQNQVVITSDPVLPASMGDTLTLTCNVSLPGVSSIFWTPSRITGTSNQLATNIPVGTSTLTIPAVLSADLGDYTCTGTNANSNSSYSSSIIVTASVSTKPITFLPISSLPFYTGTQVTINCDVRVPLSLNAEINSNVTMEGSYETPEGLHDGRLTISDLAAFTPSGKNWLYRSSITISPLVRSSDIGQWICRVNFSSDNTLIISSSFQGVYNIHEMELPALFFSIPTASVEPAFISVPDVYLDEVAFICTGTVPKRLAVNMEIVWLLNGEETTDGVSPISNPMGASSTSELRPLALTGISTYTCRVMVAVEGDPVQQDEATARLNITGPAIPNPPVGLAALNVGNRAATIVWVVTKIAYSRESYVVKYGMDVNNLTYRSNPVEGGTEFSATNQQFDTRIEELKPITKYYFIVDAINSVGNTSSLSGTFTTTELPPDAPPSNFFATDIGSTYVQFLWHPPPLDSQNGPIINYTLDCTPSTPGLSLPHTYHTYQLQNESLTGSGGFKVNVTTFTPGTMYVCTVLATNEEGDSPPAIVLVTTIQLSTPMIPTTSVDEIPTTSVDEIPTTSVDEIPTTSVDEIPTTSVDKTTSTEPQPEPKGNTGAIAGWTGAVAAMVIIIISMITIVIWLRRHPRVAIQRNTGEDLRTQEGPEMHTILHKHVASIQQCNSNGSIHH